MKYEIFFDLFLATYFLHRYEKQNSHKKIDKLDCIRT